MEAMAATLYLILLHLLAEVMAVVVYTMQTVAVQAEEFAD